jgi:hypothetical protein
VAIYVTQITSFFGPVVRYGLAKLRIDPGIDRSTLNGIQIREQLGDPGHEWTCEGVLCRPWDVGRHAEQRDCVGQDLEADLWNIAG